MEEVTNSHAEGYSGSSDETNLSTSRASGPGSIARQSERIPAPSLIRMRRVPAESIPSRNCQ